jgi:hypothetical protein
MIQAIDKRYPPPSGERAMADIRSPKLLYLKGALFVILGATASGQILLDQPTIRTAMLLAVAIWAFARAYYFAFYVIEHYVDDTYKFAGLWSFAQYTLRRKAPIEASKPLHE